MNEITLPPHGRLPPDNRMPCRWCGVPTLIETLSHYGARCFSCFEAYCREAQPMPDIGDKRTDPKGWASALERRHKAGERLSPSSIAMYRAALGRGVDYGSSQP